MSGRRGSAGKGVGAEFMQLIEQISNEKGIDVEILASAVEDAITTASRRQQERSIRPGDDATQEILVSRLNRQTGQLQLYARKMVVEQVTDPNLEVTAAEAKKADPQAQPGLHVELPRSTKGLGRIEAQAARQVLFQKVREAEREIVYRDFSPKVGDLITGTVRRFERGDVIVDLGRTEGLLPRRFQSRIEMYSQGDRVRAIVVEVSKVAKGQQVILSRTDPSLVTKMFEMEVPEIYDGTVQLRHAVREAGERAKVAVSSRQKDVDPVGACVGMKGSRVQAIIRELRGEKIDVVPAADEVTAFAASALNPAKVSRVTVADAAARVLEAVVQDQQLSLAIGKKGQNVRLAAKLVGWRIDIKSDEDKRREVEREMVEMSIRATALADVPGLPAEIAEEVTRTAGVKTVGELLQTPAETLAGLPSLADGASVRELVAKHLAAAVERETSRKDDADSVAEGEPTVSDPEPEGSGD